MKFNEVLEYLVAGYKISRKSWNGAFIEYDREMDTILYKKGKQRPAVYIPKQEDILANDWRVNLVSGFYE